MVVNSGVRLEEAQSAEAPSEEAQSVERMVGRSVPIRNREFAILTAVQSTVWCPNGLLGLAAHGPVVVVE